jgi:integrase
VKRAPSPYLVRRDGTFYVRVRVPHDLVGRVGMVEVRRSLRSGRYHECRLLALRYATRVKVLFDMIRAEDLSKEQSLQKIRAVFAELSEKVERPFAPTEGDPWMELERRADDAEFHRQWLKRQIASCQFEPIVDGTTRHLLAQLGVSVTGSTPRTQEMTIGVARALLEQQNKVLFRLDEPLLSFEPADPLFKKEVGANNDTMIIQPPAPAIGLSIAELINEFVKAHKPKWTPKTSRTNRQKLDLLKDHLGSDRLISTISPHDIWAFHDGVLRLRRNYHTDAASGFQSRQTPSEQGRISPVTAENILIRTRALFKWAAKRHYCTSNPATDVRVSQPKRKKGQKSRRPFKPAEFKQLFQSPLFTGCLSHGRRFEPGPEMIRDAKFWLPILGYYTGARLGELVQLHFEDVHINGGVMFLSINEDVPDQIEMSEHKHVKSEAGVRQIPLHPDIRALGFAEFVQRRRKIKGSRKRLFWDVKFGADGQASTVFSKWFGRALDKVGLNDPALCFHSFRHNMEDTLRNALAPKYLIDQMIGHHDPSSAGEYGEGMELSVLDEIISRLTMPVSVPSILGVVTSSGK